LLARRRGRDDLRMYPTPLLPSRTDAVAAPVQQQPLSPEGPIPPLL
jgi:hypothetical protein